MWIWWSFENIKNKKLYQTIFFVEVGGWEDKLEISLTQQSWGLSVAWAELGKIPLFIYVFKYLKDVGNNVCLNNLLSVL